MKFIKIIAACALGLSVSACAKVETATRNAPLVVQNDAIQVASAASFNIVGYNIRVPETLKVSEANLYYPLGDIVWRGDPYGDRYAQVKAIYETAFTRAIADIDGFVPVVADIEVVRFHGVSDKARFTVGGVHNLGFKITLRHPETLATIVPTQTVIADLKAMGGQKAIQADRQGNTQKVRVTAFLAETFQHLLMGTVAQEERTVKINEKTLMQNRI